MRRLNRTKLKRHDRNVKFPGKMRQSSKDRRNKDRKKK